MVDAEPERLGIELVNRYHAMKRAGMMWIAEPSFGPRQDAYVRHRTYV